MQLVAKILPRQQDMNKVIAVADKFWSEHPEEYIGIHCAYGETLAESPLWSFCLCQALAELKVMHSAKGRLCSQNCYSIASFWSFPYCREYFLIQYTNLIHLHASIRIAMTAVLGTPRKTLATSMQAGACNRFQTPPLLMLIRMA